MLSQIQLYFHYCSKGIAISSLYIFLLKKARTFHVLIATLIVFNRSVFMFMGGINGNHGYLVLNCTHMFSITTLNNDNNNREK